VHQDAGLTQQCCSLQLGLAEPACASAACALIVAIAAVGKHGTISTIAAALGYDSFGSGKMHSYMWAQQAQHT